MNDWRTYRSAGRNPRERQPRKKKVCPLCQTEVIWAQIAGPRRQGGRAFIPIPIERVAAGTGDVALTMGLFVHGEAPLAEKVSIGTGYRMHREHCPALVKSAPTSNPRAAAPKSFSAANFSNGKKPARGGSR